MRQFNIEVFTRTFSLVQHYNAGAVQYDYDYLDTTENKVVLPYDENVQRGQYIRLDNGERNYFGVISGLDVGSVAEGYTEIRYKPFLSIFDALIMFNTTWQPVNGQGGIPLEEVLIRLITAYWISNTDTAANIPGLRISAISQTANWTLHIENDVREINKAIVNLKEDLIHPALTKYQIGLYTTVDARTGTIDIKVGKRDTGVFVVEADLPNVVDRKIVLNSTTVDTNKLVVYSTEDMTTQITYYKHPDGSYNTTDTDRMIPVIATMQTVTPSQEDTLAILAQRAADKMFDSGTYNNLIELEVTNDDTLVLPASLTFGQIVSVITQGNEYPSIMTGIRVGDTTRVIFGTVRVELTKRIRRVLNNG